jgi:hypothetical protein
MTAPVTDRQIADDLEAASYDNLETFEGLWRLAGMDSTDAAAIPNGIAQDRCPDCDRPLVISEYGSWFGRTVATYTCECAA